MSCAALPGVADRVGALRLRARRLHRRPGHEEGALRAGRRRHAVPRRNRRAEPVDAGQAAARAAGARVRAARRHRADQGQRPADRRDQHRPLENADRGRRRSATDLYYRLDVFTIFAPPLRERKPDIMLLADHFLERYSREHGKHIRRISTPAIDMLTSYHWPGNVRELENTIERAVLVCDGGVIHAHHLPPTLQTGETSDTVPRAIADRQRRRLRARPAPGRAQDDARQLRPGGAAARHDRARVQLQGAQVRHRRAAVPRLSRGARLRRRVTPAWRECGDRLLDRLLDEAERVGVFPDRAVGVQQGEGRDNRIYRAISPRRSPRRTASVRLTALSLPPIEATWNLTV